MGLFVQNHSWKQAYFEVPADPPQVLRIVCAQPNETEPDVIHVVCVRDNPPGHGVFSYSVLTQSTHSLHCAALHPPSVGLSVGGIVTAAAVVVAAAAAVVGAAVVGAAVVGAAVVAAAVVAAAAWQESEQGPHFPRL